MAGEKLTTKKVVGLVGFGVVVFSCVSCIGMMWAASASMSAELEAARAACSEPNVFRPRRGSGPSPVSADDWECISPDVIADEVAAAEAAAEEERAQAQANAEAEEAASAAQEAAAAAVVENRTAALAAWQTAWEDAERTLLDEGDVAAIIALDEAQTTQPALVDACAEAREECDRFETEHINPIRNRTNPFVHYVGDISLFEERVARDEASEDPPYVRWSLLRAYIDSRDPIEEPEDCPRRVCTRERRRALANAQRRMQRLEDEADEWLQEVAHRWRDDKARLFDEALISSGIEGEVRAEGSNHDRLIVRAVLCGRVMLNRMFSSETRDALERQGFAYIGCQSRFARHGWDLNPPPLAEQDVLHARDMR